MSKKKKSEKIFDLVSDFETLSSMQHRGYGYLPSHMRPEILRRNPTPDHMILNQGDDGGFWFGIRPDGSSFGEHIVKPQDVEGHILCVGGPGSGKTARIVAPSLQTWSGHIVVIDVKSNGDLTNRCVRAGKALGKHTIIFSPTIEGGCGFDPYALLHSDGEEQLPSNAKDLANALLPLPLEVRETIWIEAAQNLLTATILFYIDCGATFSETMSACQLKTAQELIDIIEDSNNMVAKVYIGKLKDLPRKVLKSIDMELTKLAIFTTDAALDNALGGDVNFEMFNWDILNTSSSPYNIVLQLPEEKLEIWAPMTQLLLTQLIRTLERRADKHSPNGVDLPPVLIMCEEFARLGCIESIKIGMTTLRSRGITFCIVVQSLAQLDERYGVNGRRIIVDNCSYFAIMKITEPESQKYFSEMIGSIPAFGRGIGASYDLHSGGTRNYNLHMNEAREPIVYPHELAYLDKEIVLLTPNYPLAITKALPHRNYRLAHSIVEHCPSYACEREVLTYEYR